MSEKTVHKTVLLKETIEGLNIHDGSVIVDGTLGGGGHTKLICQINPLAKVYAFDLDGDAIDRSKKVLEGCNVEYIQSNFRNIKKELSDKNVESVDGIVLDLGFSSDQLETAGRGISFQKDEPLIMTLSDKPEGVTASEIVNEWGEETISDIIYGFGEDRSANRIAKAIVESRAVKPIETTFELKEIVYNAVPFFRRKGRIHPATQTFQAIRIAVNEELEVLREVLKDGFEILKPGGRMSVISFHSLEDRIVKKFFRDKEDSDLAERVTKRPIISGEEELKENRRARSAKLRILEKNK
jgi:16S rRNA (cytosine1402-N4)-methyltransferase